jgi:hypothetical protein
MDKSACAAPILIRMTSSRHCTTKNTVRRFLDTAAAHLMSATDRGISTGFSDVADPTYTEPSSAHRKRWRNVPGINGAKNQLQSSSTTKFYGRSTKDTGYYGPRAKYYSTRRGLNRPIIYVCMYV